MASGRGADFGPAAVGGGGGATMSMADWMTRRLSACRHIFLMIFSWAGKGFTSLRFSSIRYGGVPFCYVSEFRFTPQLVQN